MKKTVTTHAWATDAKYLPEIYSNEIDGHMHNIQVGGNHLKDLGWICIGTATIEMDLIDPKDTVAAQVESLQAQCQKVMADSEATLTMLRSKINDLLAIENHGQN